MDVTPHVGIEAARIGATRETIRQTLDFAFSLRTTTVQVSIATPFPGTVFYEQAREHGWLVTDDWSRYEGGCSPVVAYPDCSPSDILWGVAEAKRRKIRRLLTQPSVLGQYLLKLYQMKGAAGLLKEVVTKASFAFGRG